MTEAVGAPRLARAALPGLTYLFLLAQALNLTAAVISVTVAALVGARLAATEALGTVPYGVQFAAVMACTFPASMLMKRLGRRPVFVAGALALVVAGALGYAAVSRGSFILLVSSHALLGAYIACANFYRFAAVDALPAALRPRALSLVVAGGVLAAILGPLLASGLREVAGHAEFALCYAAFSGLGVLTLLLMLAWRRGDRAAPAAVEPERGTADKAPSLPTRGTSQAIAAAVFSAGAAYFVMNLLMVQSSLVLKGICSFDATSFAIQAHVLAMFAPSFLTGRLIGRIGLRQVLVGGFALLAAAALIGTSDARYVPMFAGLVVLGLGWNLTYVGGGVLLSQCVAEHERHRWQGINDVVIAACATLGAFAPAPLLAVAGWRLSNVLMLPLCLAGALLCWRALTTHRRLEDPLVAHDPAE